MQMKQITLAFNLANAERINRAYIRVCCVYVNVIHMHTRTTFQTAIVRFVICQTARAVRVQQRVGQARASDSFRSVKLATIAPERMGVCLS